MAETVRLVDYYYVMAPNRPGQAAAVLTALRDAGVNLLAFHGFPSGRQSQLDFVPEDAAAFKAVARKAKWKVTGPKKVFLIQGDDRVGALVQVFTRLAEAGINITANDAVTAGDGRYGALVWVDPKDVRRAARILGAA